MAAKISKTQGEELLRLVDGFNFNEVFEVLKSNGFNNAELNLLKMEFQSGASHILLFCQRFKIYINNITDKTLSENEIAEIKTHYRVFFVSYLEISREISDNTRTQLVMKQNELRLSDIQVEEVENEAKNQFDEKQKQEEEEKEQTAKKQKEIESKKEQKEAQKLNFALQQIADLQLTLEKVEQERIVAEKIAQAEKERIIAEQNEKERITAEQIKVLELAKEQAEKEKLVLKNDILLLQTTKTAPAEYEKSKNELKLEQDKITKQDELSDLKIKELEGKITKQDEISNLKIKELESKITKQDEISNLKIKELQDETSWNIAKFKDSKIFYQTYLEFNKQQGKYVLDAQNKIDEIAKADLEDAKKRREKQEIERKKAEDLAIDQAEKQMIADKKAEEESINQIFNLTCFIIYLASMIINLFLYDITNYNLVVIVDFIILILSLIIFVALYNDYYYKRDLMDEIPKLLFILGSLLPVLWVCITFPITGGNLQIISKLVVDWGFYLAILQIILPILFIQK